MPGTYFWHDHASVNMADGLHGPLIVKAKPGTPDLVDGKVQDTYTLFLQDWWHNPGNALAMRLNRWELGARSTKIWFIVLLLMTRHRTPVKADMCLQYILKCLVVAGNL